MQVEVQLVGKPNRWSYQQRRIRIGRDSSCDISLSSEEFPTVSREHVVLEFNDGVVSLSDPRSGNGTYLRGQRVSSETLQSGDIIRLGPEGPELRISVTEASAQTKVAGAADLMQTQIAVAVTQTSAATTLGAAATTVFSSATVIGSPPVLGNFGANPPGADSPTVFGRPPAQDAFIAATPVTQQTRASDAPPIQQPRSHEIRIALGSDVEAIPQLKVPEQVVAPKRHSDIGDEQMIEQKLNSLRTLLAINLVVALLLALGLLYEIQQIERNRKALVEMRMQATTAVAQFQPELDTRLNSFDQRMNSLDGKMKSEEDHFVSRMNTEIPAMLDKYIDRKMAGAKQQIETVRH